jgi:hypothetical protein
MKNTYLKRFMLLRWEDDPRKITLLFHLILFNDQTIKSDVDRTGPGYALSLFKIYSDPKIKRESQRLEKVRRDIDLTVPWNDPDHENHVTTLMILHNPAADSDSMATSDAPMI